MPSAYDGRGSAKSHFFAEQLIKRSSQARLRRVCIREVQNSIRESVRQLLIDRIGNSGSVPFVRNRVPGGPARRAPKAKDPDMTFRTSAT